MVCIDKKYQLKLFSITYHFQKIYIFYIIRRKYSTYSIWALDSNCFILFYPKYFIYTMNHRILTQVQIKLIDNKKTNQRNLKLLLNNNQ